MGCTSSKHIDPTPKYPPYSMYIPSDSFPSPSSDPATYLLNYGDRLKKGGLSGGSRFRRDEVLPRRYFHHTDEEIQLELARIRAENGIWGRRGGF